MSVSQGTLALSKHDHDQNEAPTIHNLNIESPPEKLLGTTDIAHKVPQLPGKGTVNEPYVVDWDLGEPANPYNWTKRRKWIITAQLALSTFTVSLGSSSYSGGLTFTEHDLHISEDLAVSGISLYVLGFGIGPLVMAPLSEVRLETIDCIYLP